MPPSLIAELRAACPNAIVWDEAELATRDPGFDGRNYGASRRWSNSAPHVA